MPILRKTSFSRRAFLGGLAAPLAAARKPVRITKFAVHLATLRWRDLVFLEVHTSEGLIGLGEATLETRALQVREALLWLEEAFAGKDPMAIEDHWDRMYFRLSRWRNGPAAMSALSAVDIALWDLAGKRLELPVWQVLGGALKPALRAYYTHWSAPLKSGEPNEFAEWALKTASNGWTAVKWTLPGGEDERARVKRCVQQVEAVRQAAGDRLDIGLEAAETFTTRSALELARALAPLRPLFLEEPTLREYPKALAELAARSPVPIATGEGLFSRSEFRPLLDAGGAAIIQPDVMHAGGITEIRKIASLAETYGVEIAPHQCSGPVGHVASLAAMSVCRNFFLQEWEAADDAVYREMTEDTYPVQQNGKIALPAGDGLGLKFDAGAFARRFPFREMKRRSLIQ